MVKTKHDIPGAVESKMVSLRRFLVLITLIFWLGGFTFYSAVVVPIGRQVLGSHRDQGFITRHVAPWLNIACAVFLATSAWDVFSFSPACKWPRRIVWLLLAATLIALFALYPYLDELLNPDTWQVRMRTHFRGMHAWYLSISTAQWALGLTLLFLLLRKWRTDDRAILCERRA